MLLFNPHTNERAYSDVKTRELMARVIGFFEDKGLEDRREGRAISTTPQTRPR